MSDPRHLKKFLQTKAHLSQAHQKNYNRIIKQFCRSTGWPPTEQSFTLYLADLRTRHLADSTIRLHFTLIKAYLKYLTRHEVVSIDLEAIKAPPSPEPLPLGPSGEQIKKLFDHLENRIERLIIENRLHRQWRHVRNLSILSVLFDCGLRVGEVSALRVRDVDLDNATILVYKSKTGRQRLVPFGHICRGDIRLWLHTRSELSPGIPPLFVSRRGGWGPVSKWCVRDALKRYCAESGIDYFSPHQLRHAYAGFALGSGLELGKLQRRLGHVTPAMTLRYAMLDNDLIGHHSPRDSL